VAVDVGLIAYWFLFLFVLFANSRPFFRSWWGWFVGSSLGGGLLPISFSSVFVGFISISEHDARFLCSSVCGYPCSLGPYPSLHVHFLILAQLLASFLR
jgi:hypothetical protein